MIPLPRPIHLLLLLLLAGDPLFHDLGVDATAFLDADLAAAAAAAAVAGRRPISHPQPRSTLTTLGVTATVSGTRMKMKDLWMA